MFLPLHPREHPLQEWDKAPEGGIRRVTRKYRDRTLILETDFETEDGAVTVVDLMPMSGQGTSLAIVGAYVLAGELACRPTDPPAAFGAYERAMRGFVAANQRIGRLGAERVTPPTRLGILRQHLNEFTRARFPLGRPAWLEEFGRAINGIQLPDYTGFMRPTPK